MSIRWMVPLATINLFFIIISHAKPAEIENSIDLVLLDPGFIDPDSPEVLNGMYQYRNKDRWQLPGAPGTMEKNKGLYILIYRPFTGSEKTVCATFSLNMCENPWISIL